MPKQNLRTAFQKVNRQTEARTMRIAGLVLMGAAGLSAQSVPARVKHAGKPAAETERRIVISIPDHKLALVENGRVVKVYPVAVGRQVTPSPTGIFYIANRVKNPTYYRPGAVIPPGPRDPVGTRWMGLSKPGYGIHGTNEPGSIGHAASHGCIRMRNRDAEDLFSRVRIGDVVELHAHRDAKILALLHGGEPAKPALPAASYVTTAAH